MKSLVAAGDAITLTVPHPTTDRIALVIPWTSSKLTWAGEDKAQIGVAGKD